MIAHIKGWQIENREACVDYGNIYKGESKGLCIVG